MSVYAVANKNHFFEPAIHGKKILTVKKNPLTALSKPIQKPLSFQKKLLSGASSLLPYLEDIDRFLINGGDSDSAKALEINAVLKKYQVQLPDNIKSSLWDSPKKDETHRVDLLKKIHHLAFAELGFWSQDNTWQTRKPLGKNCSERNTYSKHQYSVAKSVLAPFVQTHKTPALYGSLDSTPKSVLRSVVIRASVNGLIKKPAFSIADAAKSELIDEVKGLRQSLARYERLNTPVQSYAELPRINQRQKISGIFSSTRNSNRTAAVKELCKFISEVKTIPPKALLSAGDSSRETVAFRPNVSTNGLSQLGVIAGLFGIVEAGAGFVENIKKLRSQTKQTYFDDHMKSYYQDNIQHHNIVKRDAKYTTATFDKFYSDFKLDEAQKSLTKRNTSKTTWFDIYGNLVRYPCSAIRDGMATAVFGMRFAGKISVPLAQAVSVFTAPISMLAMGLSCIQLAKSSKRVRRIKAFQSKLDQAFTKLSVKKTVSTQTLQTFEGLINNAKRGEPRSTRLKFYKDIFSATSYATSASIATWSAVGLFASAVSGPPGWVVVGAIATAAASGAVGYGMYHAMRKIRNAPKNNIQALDKIKPIAEKLTDASNLHAHDLKILNENSFVLKRLGVCKKALTGRIEDIQALKNKASIEKLNSYIAPYDGSKNILKVIDLIRQKQCNQDTKNYLHAVGISEELIEHIENAPVTVMNIRRQAELLSKIMKVRMDMKLSDCVEYASRQM